MTTAIPTLGEKIAAARSLPLASTIASPLLYRNIGDLLHHRGSTHPERTWMVFYPDDRPETSLTYGDFLARVRATASVLLAHAVRRGDRIATISTNHSDTVIQYFAAFVIGAVVVPINTGEDDQRIGFILQNSGAKLAFVRDTLYGRIEGIILDHPGVRTMIRVTGNGEAPDGRGTFASPVGEALVNPSGHLENAIAEVDMEDEALIVYTSGTTGMPKGVVLTQRNLMEDARAIAEWHGIGPGERMMCVLPLHHVNGTVVTIMTPMFAGGSVVLNQRFHTSTFFPRIAANRVNIVSVVPTLLQFLLHQEIEMSRYDLSPLRHIICGAGPLTVELSLAFEDRFGIPIMHGYGLSETTCYSCFLPTDLTPEEHRHWLSAFGYPSIGVAIPPNEMAIHDPSGKALPEGEKGEIVIRGTNVMKEYFGNAEANELAFTHGWFRSGDEGFFRNDGKGRAFFFITGRIKELIIRGGSNISPFEIDEVLMNMPGVKAGLAVGFANDWYGEEVGAYVQPKDGVQLTDTEVMAYCRSKFPFAKCPKVVIFGSDLPVTSTGKYQRNKLKHLFAAWKGVQFTAGIRD